METDHLTVEVHPAEQDIRFLKNQLIGFNIAQTGINGAELLAIFLRNEDGLIIAGLYGWTWGGCCEVQYLWVHQDVREQGYGKRLLLAAECEAAARGCHQVILDTYSFQAPGFYQKLGYQIVGVLNNCPCHYKKYSLQKSLG